MKGRGNGNSITVGEAIKLDINYLIKNNNLQHGKERRFNLSWSNGSVIQVKTVFNNGETYVRLMYRQTDRMTKITKDFDYKIYIERVKSNLGKGYNLYFICPQSGNRCKILYLCYGAERFKCRQAYNNRIYYSTQTHSKEYRLNGRYFKLEKTINELYDKRETTTYKGKPTKRHLRLLKLLNKRAEVDNLRTAQLDKWLLKHLGLNY